MSLSLNEEQRLASTSSLGYNLVIASAGTGKTSTIVGRIKFLLENHINPEKILLLTFTNKASSEMIFRISNIFGEKIASKISAGTFHSIAYKYLKENRSIMLKQPRELKILFKSIYEKHVDFLDNIYSYQYLYDIYSLFHNSTIEKSFKEWLIERNNEQEDFIDIYENIFDEFVSLKEKYSYADYNDLLLFYKEDMLRLNKEGKTLYTEVLCDEYQDTNPLQHSIIKALDPKSLFCVGDYDQSIYAFNGANIGIITNFVKEYPESKVFTLSKNYRSGKYILELANKAIEFNERIYPKKLEIVRTNSLHKPLLLDYADSINQYENITYIIKDLHLRENIDFNDIAVIYRNNSSADILQGRLRMLEIPSKRKGSLSFFDSCEIEFILKICSIIANDKDLMSFMHVVATAKGIGNSIAKDIYENFVNIGGGCLRNGLINPNFNFSISGNGLFGSLDSSTREKFSSSVSKDFALNPILGHGKMSKDFAIFLDNFISLYKKSIYIKDPKTLLTYIFESKFFMYFKDETLKSRATQKDGKIDNNLLETSTQKFNDRLKILSNLSTNYKDIYSFLNAMVLGSSEASQGNGVNLLSIHSSKGLEFKCVFIIDLMQGRFPNIKLMSKGGSIEEERRLFYVAITRAKDRLYLSYSLRDSLKDIEYKPSQFLFECGLLKEE